MTLNSVTWPVLHLARSGMVSVAGAYLLAMLAGGAQAWAIASPWSAVMVAAVLHRTRKQMLLAIVAQERLDPLLREVTAQWEAALVKWSALPHVELIRRYSCCWRALFVHGQECPA